MQAELVDRFSCRLGTDPTAWDAARVLRLAGTFNTRCSPSRRVRCLYPEVGVPEVYRFDDVCDWILPLSREQYRARKREAWDREKRERKAARAGQRRLAVVDADAAGRLWEARLADLQRLRDLRWWGLLPPGHRDVWLFLSSCALAWMAPSAVVRREVVELGRQAIGGAWPAREVEGLMGTALRRAEAAGRGETVTYEGVEVDPRYRFRTSTILDWLSIEPDEQRSMRTLFGPEERARRWSAHQAARGRRGGAVSGERGGPERRRVPGQIKPNTRRPMANMKAAVKPTAHRTVPISARTLARSAFVSARRAANPAFMSARSSARSAFVASASRSAAAAVRTVPAMASAWRRLMPAASRCAGAQMD